jgi:hypothetical protein
MEGDELVEDPSERSESQIFKKNTMNNTELQTKSENYYFYWKSPSRFPLLQPLRLG